MKPKVMCVDDEPQVLAGLELHVRRRHQMLAAGSGPEALELAAAHPDIAVVVSDMRMPKMSGAELLARLRVALPDATRILLTGQADMESAISAVNEGHIFRFLTKPCPPETLAQALAAAVEQNRLVTSERVLLEQTLRGAIRALADVLALTNPVAFGTAKRLEGLAGSIAREVAFQPLWQVEVAAVLSQLGAVTLPHEILEKRRVGAALDAHEQEMVARAPAAAEKLVSGIPRLEPVLQMMAGLASPGRRTESPEVTRGAAILRLAVAFDRLDTRGVSAAEVIDRLRTQEPKHDPELMDALTRLRCGADEIHRVALRSLAPGMVLAEDLLLASGALLVPRGYEVTVSFVERVRNFAPGAAREPALVLIKAAPAQATRVA
ncbi:MAG: response regulator [Polyangiaceae bacterium]|nr:response regulator [Polyangiaceae bacterium]